MRKLQRGTGGAFQTAGTFLLPGQPYLAPVGELQLPHPGGKLSRVMVSGVCRLGDASALLLNVPSLIHAGHRRHCLQPDTALGWSQGKGASFPSPCPLLESWQGLWLRVLVLDPWFPRAAAAKGCWNPSSAPWEGEGANPAGCRTFLLQLLPQEPTGQGRSWTRAPKAVAPWIFPPID